MKVKVADNLYQMSRKEFRGLLKVASEQVPFGIYAVEKNDYAELLNLKCKSITQLKQRIREFKSQGWTVYANKGKILKYAEKMAAEGALMSAT